MPQSFGNSIADSLQLCLGYSKGLLKDVRPEIFGTFGDGVESNHGAFIYGHLSLYATEVVEGLGHDPIEIPAGFSEHFSKDATCIDGSAVDLPSMEAITTFYFDAWNLALEKLREADDEVLQRPTEGSMAERFPTLGSVLNFYSSGHMMMHLGQMSAWRRMHKLGPC